MPDPAKFVSLPADLGTGGRRPRPLSPESAVGLQMIKSLGVRVKEQPFLFVFPAMDFPFNIKEAALLLPGAVHLALHDPGHGSSLDASAFEGVVVLAPFSEACEEEDVKGPDWDAMHSVCEDFSNNRTVSALVVVFLVSGQVSGENAPAKPHLDLLHSAMAAGADRVLFSLPGVFVSHRELHLECESAKVQLRQFAEAREAYQQRANRRHHLCMRNQMWQSPGEVLTQIPLEDPGVAEREQGFGDTKFTRLLGEGSSAKVYRATHPVHGPVAVKVMRKSKIRNLAGLARVDREIAVLRGMRSHANVVQVHECVHAASSLYVILSYLGDHNLHHYVKLRQAEASRDPLTFPAEEVFKLLGHIVKGCHHCHAHSVCHRDLKLQNCMVNADGVVTLIDFGLAATVPFGQKLHVPCGTVPYCAPEVMRCSPESPCDGYAGDVWSLAVIAIELLCGLGSVERIVGLTPQDISNFDHIASRCRVLSEEETLAAVSSRLGRDMARSARAGVSGTLAGMLSPDAEDRFRINDVALAEPISQFIFPAVSTLGSHPQCVRYGSKRSGSTRSGSNPSTLSDLPGAAVIGDAWMTPRAPDGSDTGHLRRGRAHASEPADGEGTSLLDSFGGASVVKTAIGIHYDSLLRRPEFAQFFLGSPIRMGHIRVGIETVITQLLGDPDSCDLGMLRRVHKGHWISDHVFCEWVDTLCQTFEALGVSPYCITRFISVIDRVRGAVVSGFRERLAAAHQGQGALEDQLAKVELSAADLATCLKERHAGDQAEHEQGLLDFGEISGLLLGAKFEQLGTALHDAGVAPADLPMVCKCLTGVLRSVGLASEARESATIQIIDAVQVAAQRSCAGIPAQVAGAGEDDSQWFVATMSRLIKSDTALRTMSGRPKMSRCLHSMFSGISSSSLSMSADRLIEIHKNVVITDGIFTKVLVHASTVWGVAFPFPTYSASIRNRAVRMLETFRSRTVNS